MINKKICMMGSFAVGKTALVKRYVSSIFSDKYLSSVGVKISKKMVEFEGEEVNLLLWDLEGQDDYGGFNASYLRGAMGLVLVCDGTRSESLTVAMSLRKTALDVLGANMPHLLLINKSDMEADWEITPKVISALIAAGIPTLKTSAKEDVNVNEAFMALTAKMM